MKKTLLFILLSLTINSNGQTPGNGLTDIDGNQYSTVIIGSQEWMTTNLRTTKYNNGNFIPYQTVGNADNTIPPNLPRYFKQNNDEIDIVEKGLQYNWYTISNVNFVPSSQDGWHIPTQSEWEQLNNFVGQVPLLTKTDGVFSWSCNPASIDQYEFSLLPTGGVTFANNNSTYNFNNLVNSSQFWTTVSWSSNNAIAIQYVCNPDIITFQPSTSNKVYGKSIRLVRNTSLSTNLFNKFKVSIHPNPTKNIINLKTDQVINKIEIFDLLGKCVHIEYNRNQNINIEHLSKGIYIIKIYGENEMFNQKIIKE